MIRQLSGKLCTVSQTNKLFGIEIKAMKAGMCENDWDFTADCIAKSKETFRGMAILCAYKFGKIGDGHNFDVGIDPNTGKMERDFRGADCERIVGYIPADSNIRYEEQDGEKWLVIPAVLFRFYNTQLVEDIIKKGHKHVSVEVDTPPEWVEQLSDGKERIHQFDALGITILGDDVAPAITGAELRALSQSDKFKELSLKAASYIKGESQREQINKGVIKRMFNKADMLKKLQADFPDYSVLNVSDDGMAVALLKEGRLEIRSLEKGVESSVVPVIRAFAVVETLEKSANGKCEREYELELCDLVSVCTKGLAEKCETLTKELEKSQSLTGKLQKEVEDFRALEEKRRKEEIVSALTAARKKENGDSPDTKVLEADYNAMLEKAEKGEYATVKECVSEFAMKKLERIEAHKRAAAENKNRISYAGMGAGIENSQPLNMQEIFGSLPTYTD